MNTEPKDTPPPTPLDRAEAKVEELKDRLVDCEADKSVLKHIIVRKGAA